MEIVKLKNLKVEEISSKIKKGEIIICPTDTVYGILCDARNAKAVSKIFKLKKREKTKPLAIFVDGIKMAKKYSVIRKREEDFLKRKWPGKNTAILRSKKGLAKLVYKEDTIGIRFPKCKIIKDILKIIKTPLAQTSANISGRVCLTEIKKVIKEFDKKDVLIIDAGNLGKNKPSKIFDLSEKNIKILRK